VCLANHTLCVYINYNSVLTVVSLMMSNDMHCIYERDRPIDCSKVLMI